MMKQTKRILAMLLVLAMAVAMTACSSGTSQSEASTSSTISTATSEDITETSADNGERAVIAFWTTNRHDADYLTPLIEEFNDTHPDIYIDYQIYADNYSQMLDLAFSTNSAPDIYMISSTDSLEIQVNEKKQLMDLSQFMTDEDYERFGEGAFVEGINALGDGIYSFPYTASAVRLFYNQDIFDRVGITDPPTTLDELVADATLITNELSSEGIYGFAANFKTASTAVARTIDAINTRSGGNRSGFDYTTGTFDFSTYKPVLEAFQDMFATGVAFPGCESLDIDPLRTQFAAGKIGMYMSLSHAEPGVYESQFPTEENWNCAQIPTVSGNVDGKQQLWFGGTMFGINPDTSYPQQAWEVFQFLHSDEVMSGYYTAGLGTVMIPSAVENATPPESISKMPDLAINDDDVQYPVMPTVVVEGKDYYTVMVECIFGMTDIDTAIEDLNTRYNAAYNKAVEAGEERVVYPNFTPLEQDTSR